jgi:phosphomannomutase
LRTVATTHTVDRVAGIFGLKTVEVPVGFKYIAPYILKGRCLLGGEESGGLSVAGHVPEKDGILAGLLMTEMLAVWGRSIGAVLRELYARTGRLFNRRSDFKLSLRQKNRVVAKLQRPSPKTFAGKKVRRLSRRDGYKLLLSDGSWVLYRTSGTEPVIRMYCEAFSKADLKRLIAEGEKYVGL